MVVTQSPGLGSVLPDRAPGWARNHVHTPPSLGTPSGFEPGSPDATNSIFLNDLRSTSHTKEVRSGKPLFTGSVKHVYRWATERPCGKVRGDSGWSPKKRWAGGGPGDPALRPLAAVTGAGGNWARPDPERAPRLQRSLLRRTFLPSRSSLRVSSPGQREPTREREGPETWQSSA